MENTEQTQEQLSALLQVRRDKLTELQNDGRDPFKITKFERTHTSAQLKENYTEEDRELKKRGSDEVQIIKAQVSQFDGQTVSIAGRIMSKRGMGKVGFVHVSDIDGQIQLFVKKDILGEDEYARFKKLDIGDIIGAEGEVFTTQTGEISVRAEKITLLSKSLLPLPEKFHGMTDTDLRYRQRYIDLIMNADVKKTFINRSKIIASIRSYLNGQNFLEVETPMLVANAGGAAARPFETQLEVAKEEKEPETPQEAAETEAVPEISDDEIQDFAPVAENTENSASDLEIPVKSEPEEKSIQDELDSIFDSENKLENIFAQEAKNFPEAKEGFEIEIPQEELTEEDYLILKMPTKYIKQTVRSGQVIKAEGNLVIIGDCHPGSEVHAQGDITVWGALGGIAHAGSEGNKKARIRALQLNAIQLRIADFFARRPDASNIVYVDKSNTVMPEEARIVKDNIVILKLND